MASVASLVQQETKHKTSSRVRWYPAHRGMGTHGRTLSNSVAQETRWTVPDTCWQAHAGSSRGHRADQSRGGDLRVSRVQGVC